MPTMVANARFQFGQQRCPGEKDIRLMASNDDAPVGAANGNGNTGAQPSLNVLAQYVKDLSFESPGAPNSLRGRDKAPGIAINVNVNANPLSDKQFDVNLTLNAK